MQKFKTAYGKRERVFTKVIGLSMTEQCHKDDCDINRIMKKYHRTGHMEHCKNYAGEYGFATSETYHEAMNVVLKAQDMFDELPSTTRKKFNNDPQEFLNFVQNPDNTKELVELGLANPPENQPQSQSQSQVQTKNETQNQQNQQNQQTQENMQNNSEK